MQWLDRRQLIVFLCVLLLSGIMMGLGYRHWLQPLPWHGVVHARPVALKKVVFVFDEPAELTRWSSLNGGLLLWQRKGQVIKFRWLGSYAAMLRVLCAWPPGLLIKHLHWQRGENGGVEWSGEYAMAD